MRKALFPTVQQFKQYFCTSSPVQVPVSTRDGRPKPNAKKVRAFGPGLEPGQVLPGKPTHFTVDASDTAPAPVDVDIRDKDGNKLRVRIAVFFLQTK